MTEKSLDELTKDEVADVAAALFSMQLLGPTVILELANKHPWLVERAPSRWEVEALLDLARRGKTIDEADDKYFKLCQELRRRYSFEEQARLWDEGEPCFPLVVSAAMTRLHDPDKVAAELGVNRVMLRRWELGLSTPNRKLQAQAVDAFRKAIKTQDEED